MHLIFETQRRMRNEVRTVAVQQQDHRRVGVNQYLNAFQKHLQQIRKLQVSLLKTGDRVASIKRIP